MASHVKRKSTHVELENHADLDDLFSDKAIIDDVDSGDSDSTDSEESVYSGLEEEDDDESEEEDDEEEESEENESSMSEGSSDDAASETEQPLKENDAQTKKSKKKKAKNAVDNQPSTSKDDNKNIVYPDEYEFDSSDEEDIRNTVGNIPMEWYREYGHIGYDWEGRKLVAPKSGDELDDFLDKMENPDYWRTIQDKMTGQNVVLSAEDVEIIQRIRKGKYADSSYDPHEPWTEIFVDKPMIHPVTNRPEHKRSFIPSHNERLKVGRMVHAMKMGWMKPMRPPDEENKEVEAKYYMLWGDEDQSEVNKRLRMHIPAPKLPLPGHSESYNPPPEYLLSKEEEEAWNEQDPEDRRVNFIPKMYSSLRHVPSFKRFINERFERCLDLYLCPRQRKMRMNVNAEDLIPKLPKPRDLQPFPTTQAIVFKGHSGLVRAISVDPQGQWLASGSDDKTVKFWEVSTGRCIKTMKVKGAVKSIAWNPNPALSLVAIAVNNDLLLVNPGLGDKVLITATDNMLSLFESPEDSSEKANLVTWDDECDSTENEGLRLRLSHSNPVSQVTWHGRGDYFATLMPAGQSLSVAIHQLSKRKSQTPFKKSKGLVQCVRFHPTRPFFFVATQRYVRVYNLVKQELTKKLMTNCKWVSSLAIHPGGDNLIIGSYDCRLSWFDLDLSTKPYQTLRHHKKAIRQVAYHSRYPLFASASDDGTVIVCHGKVYNDLMQNPLIVPVKVLRGHEPTKDLGVLDCTFHPTQPWLFSSGSDMTIRLFT